jgi:hypothetical protein
LSLHPPELRELTLAPTADTALIFPFAESFSQQTTRLSNGRQLRGGPRLRSLHAIRVYLCGIRTSCPLPLSALIANPFSAHQGGFLFGYDSSNIGGVLSMGNWLSIFGYSHPDGVGCALSGEYQGQT